MFKIKFNDGKYYFCMTSGLECQLITSRLLKIKLEALKAMLHLTLLQQIHGFYAVINKIHPMDTILSDSPPPPPPYSKTHTCIIRESSLLRFPRASVVMTSSLMRRRRLWVMVRFSLTTSSNTGY
jgi:hypothetical protein